MGHLLVRSIRDRSTCAESNTEGLPGQLPGPALQDALPLTLGQEFLGYAGQIEIATHNPKNSLSYLQELAILLLRRLFYRRGLFSPLHLQRSLYKHRFH